ncbi:MAG: UDP-N-acetylglucosamine--N-acetylmuramyl-(pentapeptide) pyrophosphoryl-undecaprenol N-acetylglucosamine transferase [Clostridia bacterium]|nr:UDP-N-acetylglucosamine--N-acetylmuramyl-(pentapeptide) pyrophosphoryl-undecaprenol N-acetylglucosamine transferase [Clostridia bacterium]
MNTIVLTGGGTAGHVTPNLNIIPKLKKHFDKIYYIGSCEIEEKIIKPTGIPFYKISSTKLIRGKFFANLAIPFKLNKAIKEAKVILKEIKPDVVFSKGGFVSVPVVFAANALNIPIVCHESDLSLGLANRICARKAKTICTTFPLTSEKGGEKFVCSGSPVNLDLLNIPVTEAKTKLKIKTSLPILLVTGGSLGSAAINNVVFEALNELTKKYYVIHVTGKGNTKNINLPNYLQIEYANNLPLLICASSVVVSRAGSNTIFELALANKPMLLIPLPKGASRGDQVENANYFKSKNIANVLLQENLNKSSLINEIDKTYNQREDLIKAIKKFNPKSGVDKIVYEIIKAKR